MTYKTDHKIDGRIMKIRREFTAHVPTQVCDPDVEREIGKLLKDVNSSVRIRMTFAPLPKKEQPAAQADPAPTPAPAPAADPAADPVPGKPSISEKSAGQTH
mgnify:CR=1 FL=1